MARKKQKTLVEPEPVVVDMPPEPISPIVVIQVKPEPQPEPVIVDYDNHTKCLPHNKYNCPRCRKGR